MSDAPAAPVPEDYGSVHEKALRFMGAFSSAQMHIDWMLAGYVRERMPSLGEQFCTDVLHRIRDDQRLRFFLAFAADVGYEGDLTQFDRVYNRAKETRDLIGHSVAIIGPVQVHQDAPPSISVGQATRKNRPLVPDPLVPSTFDRLAVDCEWISQHAFRAGWTHEPDRFRSLGGDEPFEPPAPPHLPAGGEPI